MDGLLQDDSDIRWQSVRRRSEAKLEIPDPTSSRVIRGQHRSMASTYKVLFFVARNPQMTPAEFKDHYENKHVPLLKSLLGTMKQHGIHESSRPLQYRRLYIDRDASDPKSGNPGIFGETAPIIEYDVVTEMAFSDKDAAAGFVQLLFGIEENAKRIMADEWKLIDVAKRKAFVVEEHDGM